MFEIILKIFFLVFITDLCSITSQVNCEQSNDELDLRPKYFEKAVYLKTVRSNEEAFKFFNPDFDRYLAIYDSILNDSTSNLSIECDQSLNTLRQGLIEKNEWALKYYESSGSPNGRFLSGYHHDLGAYLKEVGKEIKYREAGQSVRPFTKFMIDFSYGTVLGFCVSEKCDINSLTSSINTLLQDYDLKAVPQVNCSINPVSINQLTRMINDPKFLILGTILLIPALICLLTLIVDWDILWPFSLKDNFDYVYNLKKPSENAFLMGFKFTYIPISICSHILGVFYIGGYAPFLWAGLKEMNTNFVLRGIFERILMGVDVMLFYSSFQAFQVLYQQMKKKNSNFYKSILFWPMALYPNYIAFTAIGLFIASFINGIYAADMQRLVFENFWTNGWKTFTFTSNFDFFNEQFAAYNCFNSVTFQLFVMSYGLIYLFAKNEALGVSVSLITFAINTIYLAWSMPIDNVPAYFSVLNGDIITFFDFQKDYMYFYNHVDVYLIGILTGWAYCTERISLLKNRIIFTALLIITPILSICFLYVPLLFDLGLIPNNHILLIAFYLFKRTLLPLLMVVLFLSFKAGRLELLRKIMEWPYFGPLSRLSASLVSTQFIYYFYVLCTRTEQLSFTFETMLKEFAFAIACTFILANISFLFYEAPLQRIFRFLLLGRSKTKSRFTKAIEKVERIEDKQINVILFNNKNLNNNC